MKTETDVQNLSREAIHAAGGVAWRNNRGVAREIDAHDENRVRYIRYGLANDSEKFAKIFRTGDLVGMFPVTVYLAEIRGAVLAPYTVAIFCMWECKVPDWQWAGTEHEKAQLNAINYVRQRGGRAGFVTHPSVALDIARGQSMGAAHG